MRQGSLAFAAGDGRGGCRCGDTDRQVKIENAWARPTPAGTSTSAAYMTLVAPAADRLVSVSTPGETGRSAHCDDRKRE